MPEKAERFPKSAAKKGAAIMNPEERKNRYRRKNPLFALCGLNCGLCPMKIGGTCPGCGGGEGNQPCAILRCACQRGQIEYCTQCGDFPCGKYADAGPYELFIPNRNRLKDLERAAHTGLDAYQQELDEKVNILHDLIDHWNDGRRKSFYCLAVNLLELKDVQTVVGKLREEIEPEKLTLKQKAERAAALFRETAEKRGILLKLYRKPKKEK